MTTSNFPKRVLVTLSFTSDPLDPAFGLVPMDKNLVSQALWYAEKVGASLTFLHTLEEEDFVLPSSEDRYHALMRQKIQPLLDELVARCTRMGVTCESILADDGPAWHKTLRMVESNGFDLVMTGPRRRDQPFMDRILHGSTTRRLLRKCPVPVWVTHPGNNLDVKRVLVPVDFSDVSKKAVRVANDFAALTGAERILVHFMRYPGDFAANRSPEPEKALQEYHAEVRKNTEEKIKNLLGDNFDDWRISMVDGDIFEVIEEAVKTEDIDLLIMGSVARKGLVGFVMGNTAEKLLPHIQSPLWILKPDDWQQES